jgi:6,7-dimethyl-8-ribityllumazine synthase
MKIGIVASEYNWDITMEMLERAKDHAQFLGADVVKVVRVPGVYDMPLGAKKLLSMKDIQGVVAIGAVIEGETEHDQVIMTQTARKLMDLGCEFNKPIGLGITGPGMTRLQAEERISNAKDAVESVVKMIKNLEK